MIIQKINTTFWQRLSFLLLAGFLFQNHVYAENLIATQCHNYFMRSDFLNGLTQTENVALATLARKYAKIQASGHSMDRSNGTEQADVKRLIQQELLSLSRSLSVRGVRHDFFILKRIFIERTQEALKNVDKILSAQDGLQRTNQIQQSITHNKALSQKIKNILKFYHVKTMEDALVHIAEKQKLESGDLESAELLLSVGADVNIPGKFWGTSLLTNAVRGNHEALVELFLKWGADVEPVGELGKCRPLEKIQTPRIAQLLLNAGARLDAVSADGFTALMKIILYGGGSKLKEIVESRYAGVAILIEVGANIHMPDNMGNTAFMHASRLGLLDIVELLLKNGAARDEKNNEGNTALMLAVLSIDADMVQRLLEKKADITLKNSAGQTALDMAISNSKRIRLKTSSNKDTAQAAKKTIKRLLRQQNPNHPYYWFSKAGIFLKEIWIKVAQP